MFINVTLVILWYVREDFGLITNQSHGDILSDHIQLIFHYLRFNSKLYNVKYGKNR
jgi:hypothetical protein